MEREVKKVRGERGKEKVREDGGERARYMYTREDGYRVPNRDPRDRVIRIEMNVNPLNTIPGQNTATRGSESGQIRYRGRAGPARARCDPVGCSSQILSLYVPLRRRHRRHRRHRRRRRAPRDLPYRWALNLACGPQECLVRIRPNEVLIAVTTSMHNT